MIGSLRGRLLSKKPDNILVEACGVGYHVHVPLTLLSEMPREGEEIFLHVHTHVRDDALQLYGFGAEEEKRIFTTLLGISGIGPKMALNVLSGLSLAEFHAALETEDVAMLCRVPGLGKKTAHRLILELREKLPSGYGSADRVFNDALSALMNLGYKKNVAQGFLEQVYSQGQTDIETLIREALKLMSEKKHG